jgi:hypothetical protein
MRGKQVTYEIVPYKGKFYVGIRTKQVTGGILGQTISDEQGIVLFYRWIEAYDWIVANKLNGNYALAQRIIS